MASRSKLPKSRIEDRISELPEEVLCHILSFLTTLESVPTSVLSHRWKNVWASVPTLHLDELEFYKHCLKTREDYEPSNFEEFVDDLLSNRSEANIHRFRLHVYCHGINSSRIGAWISAAVRHNVVELDLSIRNPTRPHLEIPMGLFTCNTLTSLKLRVCSDVSAMTPSSHCFSSLKFLHVKVEYPDSVFVEKFFSCFPVLEDLIIDGQVADAYNFDISAHKLKRLQIRIIVIPFAMNNGCQIFVSADTPNLEEVDIKYDCLVSYSLKNVKCLRKAKIDFQVDDLGHDFYRGLPDRICQLFADLCHAKHLKVSAPILDALDIRYHSRLLTFSNLSHLELELPTCRYLQSLTTWLKISPNLAHLKISTNRDIDYGSDSYCDYIKLDGRDAPETAPVCLISHLKTVCLWDFQGCPDDMEIAKYLVKYGKALNRVTIHTNYSKDKEMKSQFPTSLWSKFSEFPRGSKTCEIEFRMII